MTTKNGRRTKHLAKQIRQQFLGDRSVQDDPGPDLRVVLYSHDTMGIGHMRRNLLIANHIKSRFPNASILTIAGAKEASLFAQVANIDCLTLPAYQKRSDGSYACRSLGIPVDEILDFRSRTILTAVQSFQPDLLIADKIPSGAGGELLPSLEWLSRHSSCHCVLGLRDILDTPEVVTRDWKRSHTFEVIRDHFASIWIYGDPNVFDAVGKYEFPDDIATKVLYTGYLNTRSRFHDQPESVQKDEDPFVLCTVGGGQDGEKLPLQFVEAIRASGKKATLLTGPYMPESTKSQLHVAAESIPSLRVIEFVNEGDVLVKQASHVVSMGGYNTLSAILSYDKPALIVPRVTPRKEQLIRASRFAELGLVETVHPSELSSELILQWLDRTNPNQIRSNTLDMDGLSRIGESIHASIPTAKFCPTGECDG